MVPPASIEPSNGDSNGEARANHTDVGMGDTARKSVADNRTGSNIREGRSLGRIDTGKGESRVLRKDQRTVEGNNRLCHRNLYR